jgi:uncharacterized membrane protein
LPDKLAEILSDPAIIKDPEARETVTQIIAAYEATQGPLPPPGMLKQYEAILPGISHRMFRQVELQSDHRRALENRALDSSIKRASRGQSFALLIMLLTIGVGAFLIYVDKPLSGFGVLLAGIVPVLGAFLYSQRRQRRELREKWDAFEDKDSDDDHGELELEQLTIAAEERRKARSR